MAAKIGKTMETCCKGAEHKKGDKIQAGLFFKILTLLDFDHFKILMLSDSDTFQF